MAEDTLLRLLDLETPWVWNIPIPDQQIKPFIFKTNEKCSKLEDESEFQWNIYTLRLLLAYELCEKSADFDKALEHVQFCENHLSKLLRSNCKEALFTSIKTALLHVTFATKANILHLAHRSDKEVQGSLKNAELHPIVNNRDKAGVLGIKAGVCIQYGTNGQRLSLKLAKEAVELDPDQAEWNFLVGNTLGKIRRIEHGEISKEEVTAIEKAFVLEKNASYIVHLAQIFGETSSFLYYTAHSDKEKLNKVKALAKKAVDRYKEAIELRPNCPNLKARVAHGLIRIKDKDVLDLKYIKALLDDVVKMTPNNSMVYHDLGLYYANFEKDIEKAIQSLEKSHDLHNLKGFLYMTLLKWKHGLDEEIINDIKEALKSYPQEDNQAELLIHLGACYILIENDLESAVEHFNESLAVDPTAKYLQNYHGFRGRNSNLLVLVTKEVLNQITKTKSCEEFIKKSQTIVYIDDAKKPVRYFRSPLEIWKRDQLSVKAKKSICES